MLNPLVFREFLFPNISKKLVKDKLLSSTIWTKETKLLANPNQKCRKSRARISTSMFHLFLDLSNLMRKVKRITRALTKSIPKLCSKDPIPTTSSWKSYMKILTMKITSQIQREENTCQIESEILLKKIIYMFFLFKNWKNCICNEILLKL